MTSGQVGTGQGGTHEKDRVQLQQQLLELHKRYKVERKRAVQYAAERTREIEMQLQQPTYLPMISNEIIFEICKMMIQATSR